MVSAARPPSLGVRWVDVGWWDEAHLSGLDQDFPALAVDVVVASGAQHDPVVQVGEAASIPPDDVVGFAVFWWGMTLRAPPVTFQQCESLGGGEESDLATEVEDLTVTCEDRGDDARVPCQPAQLTHRDGLIGAINTAHTLTGGEVTLVHAHNDRGADPRRVRLLAPKSVATHLKQGVGPHLPHRSLILVQAGPDPGGHETGG